MNTDSPVAPGGRWTPAVAARRAREILAEEGPRSLWFKLAGELGYRRLRIFELPLAAAPPVPAEPELELAEPSPGDAPSVEALVELNPAAPAEEVRARLAAGHRCWLARLGGEPAAACWVSGPGQAVPLPYLGHDVPMGPGEACTFETWTDPRFRGRGLGPALRLSVAHELKDGGLDRLLAMIYPENAPAIRMVEKLGYRAIGTAAAVGPLGRSRLLLRMRGGARCPGAAA